MNAIDLMGRLGGSILGHKIRATINGEIVILAKLNGENWELTEKARLWLTNTRMLQQRKKLLKFAKSRLCGRIYFSNQKKFSGLTTNL